MVYSNALFVVLIAVASSSAKEICFEDMGCFIDSAPFSGTLQRPIAVLPQSPQKINTTFMLFVDKNSQGESITRLQIPTSFDSSLPTKFIVHGFFHDAQKPWVIDMKNALLNATRANVITVDWSGGNGLPYTQATANTQIVGAEIANVSRK
jgi:pancreatic triacylglycerol lipase